MDEGEILSRLGLALAIGFLIGLERGWREREQPEGERAAGLRTFTLVGLAGGIFAFLGQSFGAGVVAAGFIAIGGAVAYFRAREVAHEGGFGATTVVAAFLTFGLGAFAVAGDMTAAAAAAVATAAILSAKRWLHAWLQSLTWQELRAALILAAMSFIALPVLPDRGFGPYEALNPRELWLMTIAIAGVSFMGYVAVRVIGTRYGPLVAGVAGGIVSSTITTVDLARKAKQAPASRRQQLGGALAASATMFIRVAAIVAVFGPSLLPGVIAPLAAALVVTAIGAVIASASFARAAGGRKEAGPPLTNPFELKTVLFFGALLAVIVLVSRALTELFGGASDIALAAVAGLGDVDALSLSMTRLAGGGTVSLAIAGAAILTAVTANSLSKSFLAIVTGGRWFGAAYSAVTLAAILAGGLVVLSQAWVF